MRKEKIAAVLAALCALACLTAGCRPADTPQVEDTPTQAATEPVQDVQTKPQETQEIPQDAPQEPAITSEEQQPDDKEILIDKGILIAIDPGHQAWDVDMSAVEPNAPGSSVMKAKASTGTSGTFSGIAEYELNMDISLLLRDALEQQGYTVLLTREDNQTAISNAERAQMANEAGADIYLRIHANGSESADVSGALALIGSAENPYVGSLYEESSRLATCILAAYCAETGFADRGIQLNDTMTGINWSQVPVVILEMGFMTNQHDDLAMADADFRQVMVQGIVNGVNAYYEQPE